MTDNLQPAAHLSPDQLSAFAENVLPEHERLAALTHLADCPDCRQVVFLAQQADPASMAPVPVVETARRGWFTVPQIFGAATAALACSLILALIVHQRHTEIPSTPSVTTAKVEPPPSVEPPKAAPSQATAAPSVRYGPRDPGPTSVGIVPTPPSPVQVQMTPAPQTLGVMGAGMPMGHSTEAKQKDKASLDSYSAPAASTYASLPPKAPAVVGGVMPMPAAPPTGGHFHGSYTDTEKSANSYAADSLAAPVPPPAKASSQAAPVLINGADIEDLPLSGRAMVNNTAAKPAAPAIQLPSNKAVANVLRTAGRTLALDTAGTLFLSLDRGKHWTAVTPQWSGKVAKISLATAPPRLYLQQPSQTQTQTQAKTGIDANGISQQQAPIPAAGFDLTTVTGAVWHSTDGLTWRAR